MTDEQMKLLVSSISGETSDVIISAFLSMSADAIINRAFPFATEDERESLTVPKRYQNLQCEIAIYLLNKRGAEGQTSHSENGISRDYENGSVPDSMLKQITPFCQALGGGSGNAYTSSQ